MTPRSDERQRTECAPGKPEREPQESREPAADSGCCERIEQALDDALADSFPASDPVSIVTSQREEAWEIEQEKADRDRPPAKPAP